MTAAAITVGSALFIVFLLAMVLDWRDEAAYRREREQDREPLSRLDRADGLHDLDDDWNGWKP